MSTIDRLEILKEKLEEEEREIERLNKKIEQYENPEDMTLMFMWCDEKAKDEIKRLNNIINEFDKWLLGEQMMFYRGSDDERLIRYGETKYKWLELKGSDSNE